MMAMSAAKATIIRTVPHFVCSTLGITFNAVRKRADLAQRERVPRPAGKAGKQLYWSRPEVECWFGERR